MKKIFGIICFILSVSTSFAGEVNPEDVLRKMDELLNFSFDLQCNMTMVQHTPGEKDFVYKFKIYYRDFEEKSLAIVIAPEVEKGTGYLKIGDNFWTYNPISRKFTHTLRKNSIQNSVMTQDDLKSFSYSTDYSIENFTEAEFKGIPVYVLDIKGKHKDVAYERNKIWVRKDVNLPVKIENFSLSGKIMRTVYYPKWGKIEDKYIWLKILFTDMIQNDRKTQVTFSDLDINDLMDSIFTKAFLEKVNR